MKTRQLARVFFNRFLAFLISTESAAGVVIPILYEVFS